MKWEENIQGIDKFQVLVTLVIVLFFCITGYTYAYFAFSASDNTTIVGEAATVNLTLSVERVFPLNSSDNTGVMVPQLSGTGASSPLSTALKQGCVDGNHNIVCQVYKIDIENRGGTATQVVDGKVLFYGDSSLSSDLSQVMPNLKWKMITSADAAAPSNSVLGSFPIISANADEETGVLVSDLSLSTDEKKEYYIIVWIDETNEEQAVDKGKTFYGKVEFTSSNGTGVTSTF